MRLKAIVCQVFTREIQVAVSRSPHEVDMEILQMGMHAHGEVMRARLQERIDAADGEGYDAIVLGYALCGGATEGLKAGRTPVVMPRAHDCIDVLMGGHAKSLVFFETHPGVYYRSPGWVEFLQAGSARPPARFKNAFGVNRPAAEPVTPYGEDNARYTFDDFGTSGRKDTGLVYISTGVPGDEQFRRKAQAEAEAQKQEFDEYNGSIEVLERLLCGAWNPEEFLIIPPGSSVRAVLGASIVDMS